MASISGNGANGHHKFTLNVNEDSYSIANNTSSVSFSFVISPIETSWNWSGWNNDQISYVVNINGTKFTGSISAYDGYNSVTLKSGTLSIAHDTDGKKSISFSFSVTDGAKQYYTCGNASASGTMNLTTIPRYLSITKFEVTNITETSVIVKWETSDPRNATYYSLDKGANWIGSATDGETLESNNKGGTFNIPKLTANTTYNIRIKICRTDSSLWTESADKSFTTYDYPHCTDSPDFTIGDAITLTIYNPLSRTCTVCMELANGYVNGGDVISGKSLWGYNGEGWQNILYNSIPNAQSGKYKVLVKYGDITKTRDAGNTYKIRGTEIPTINGLDYYDSNNTTVALTGNNKLIIQNKSDLTATFDPATPNKGAGKIASYMVTCHGKGFDGSVVEPYPLGTIDSERDVELTLTATDSRGLSASKTIKVTMVAYSDPTATVTLQRLNNYEDETYLIVDGSVSSINGKNTMDIKYRYKVTGGSYGAFVTIGDREKHTLSLDKNNEYIFNVVITDEFGSYIKEHTLGKGVFPLFIDTVKNSVGINCFPAENKSLEVNGFNVLDVFRSNKSIGVGEGGLKITIDKFTNSDKMMMFIAGADNSSLTPVLTVVHLRTDGKIGYKNLGLEKTVTRSGNIVHIDASQWSYYTVFVPLEAEITLSSGAL